MKMELEFRCPQCGGKDAENRKCLTREVRGPAPIISSCDFQWPATDDYKHFVLITTFDSPTELNVTRLGLLLKH